MQYIDESILKKFNFPKKESHKGQNGKILIIGGSKTYYGAPILSALSALPFCDLVYLYVPSHVYEKIHDPQLIVYRANKDILCKKDVSRVLLLLNKVDVVLLGPGIGKEKETQKFVNSLLKVCEKKMVIDADALKIMKEVPQKSILTPNLYEYEKYISPLMEVLLKNENVIIKKGKEDVIYYKDQKFVNERGSVALTKGGTGDILSGITAALYTKHNILDTSLLSVYLLGMVAEEMEKKYNVFFTPLHIISEMPLILAKLFK